MVSFFWLPVFPQADSSACYWGHQLATCIIHVYIYIYIFSFISVPRCSCALVCEHISFHDSQTRSPESIDAIITCLLVQNIYWVALDSVYIILTHVILWVCSALMRQNGASDVSKMSGQLVPTYFGDITCHCRAQPRCRWHFVFWSRCSCIHTHCDIEPCCRVLALSNVPVGRSCACLLHQPA